MDTRHHERGIVAHKPVARTQPQRVLGAVDGLLVRPLNGERISEMGVSQREVRVQLQRPAQRTHGLIEAAQSTEQHALYEVYPGVAVVEGECGLRFCADFGHDRSQAARPHRAAQQRPG